MPRIQYTICHEERREHCADKERGVVNVAKTVDKKEAYENLANAIIVLAVEDYKAALKHLKKSPENKGAIAGVKRLEKFFHSEWYEFLTDLDASYLLRKVRELVEEEC